MAAIFTEERFAAAAERLPTTPQVFDRLNAVMKDPDVGIDEIASIVQLDVSLSARVIRLSNGAHFARGGERATHLSEAIGRIGFQEVFRLVGAAMSAQLYVTGLPVYGLGGDELWENSLTTAVALESLAETAGVDRKVGYTLGLLRPVGRLILQRLASAASCPPMSGRKATAALVLEWEKSTVGLTSGEATARLFDLWKLSPAWAGPIRYHFNPLEDPDNNPYTALLHIASWVAFTIGKGLVIEKDAWTLDEAILLKAALPSGAAEACVEKTKIAAQKLGTVMKAA